jgi:hypothetical protein
VSGKRQIGSELYGGRRYSSIQAAAATEQAARLSSWSFRNREPHASFGDFCNKIGRELSYPVLTTWRARAAPFDSLSIADIGDVAINTFDLKKSIGIIEAAFDEILSHNVKPLVTQFLADAALN